ncbi:MAG: nucleotide disphospho-sugar-binding domain-containing protein [Pseudonocardiaceae bacterium]
MRCGICGRKMQGAMIRKHHTYYRCLARTLAPGSVALADHPKTVNLCEDSVLKPLNSWIGHLFSRESVDQTVAALIASQKETAAASNGRDAMTKRLAAAEARLRRYQAAVAAGVDPAAVVEVINDAQAQRAAAQAELQGAPAPNELTGAEVYAPVTHAGMGSTMEALYYGVPLVAFPQMPEQVVNADRIQELGLGQRLDAERLTAGTLQAAVWQVTSSPKIRANLDRMRAAARGGGAAEGADAIEQYLP